MVDALDIGYAIKDRRARLGLTQAQVAQAAGVSKRCLWSLELGRSPGVQLDKLTAVLGVLGLELVLGDAGAPVAPGAPAAPRRLAPAEARPSEPEAPLGSRVGDGGIDALAILTGAAR